MSASSDKTVGVRSMPRYITRLSQLDSISETEKEALAPVAERFAFRSNTYYHSLMDPNDPNDPIRRLVVPHVSELEEWGALDASAEHSFTPVPGIEHKYPDTALLLVNDVCGAYCRFCFRKRLFMNDNDEVVKDVSGGLSYIRQHPEINNVLLTGGDPLILATHKLERILRALREIDHVQILRIGSKMPAFNPFRILDDASLTAMLSRYSTSHRRVYVMAHFNHPVELTEEAIEGLHMLRQAGVVTVNQTPLIRGVNDEAEVLHALFDRLSFIGVPPYYVFQCRPTAGNKEFALPLERSFEIFDQARTRSSGLAKRARFCMSHRLGKVEILAAFKGEVIMKFHRAARAEDEGRVFSVVSDPKAYWLDDYSSFQEGPWGSPGHPTAA